MGIVLHWHEEVLNAFSGFGLLVNLKPDGLHWILDFDEGHDLGGSRLAVDLVSVSAAPEPAALVALQERYAADGCQLVHLWEDIWKSRQAQVMGRIAALLGLNKRIHGRQTVVARVSQAVADDFLSRHHLQGAVRTRYRLALLFGAEVMALACFSNLRLMKGHAGEYRSAELARFANRTGYTVTGGFSKLLNAFIAEFRPDDVMSYADRDWSAGGVYLRAGFVLKARTPPARIWLDPLSLERFFPHRIPGPVADDGRGYDLLPVFNTGNLKYVLYLKGAAVV